MVLSIRRCVSGGFCSSVGVGDGDGGCGRGGRDGCRGKKNGVDSNRTSSNTANDSVEFQSTTRGHQPIKRTFVQQHDRSTPPPPPPPHPSVARVFVLLRVPLRPSINDRTIPEYNNKKYTPDQTRLSPGWMRWPERGWTTRAWRRTGRTMRSPSSGHRSS